MTTPVATDNPAIQRAATEMATYGGSFVKALAHAFFCADPENRKRLRTAFGDYFIKYGATPE